MLYYCVLFTPRYLFSFNFLFCLCVHRNDVFFQFAVFSKMCATQRTKYKDVSNVEFFENSVRFFFVLFVFALHLCSLRRYFSPFCFLSSNFRFLQEWPTTTSNLPCPCSVSEHKHAWFHVCRLSSVAFQADLWRWHDFISQINKGSDRLVCFARHVTSPTGCMLTHGLCSTAAGCSFSVFRRKCFPFLRQWMPPLSLQPPSYVRKPPTLLDSPSLHKLNLFPLHLTQERKHAGAGAFIQTL